METLISKTLITRVTKFSDNIIIITPLPESMQHKIRKRSLCFQKSFGHVGSGYISVGQGRVYILVSSKKKYFTMTK